MSNMAIDLIHIGLPTSTTLEKIKADVKEDLLKKNQYSQGSKKEYLDTPTIRRLLNDAFECRWSWEIVTFKVMSDPNGDYALVQGRLFLPGLGFRDAFGAAKLYSDGKKDNSAAFASASSYAFKNAVKGIGFAANLFDENFDEDLWYDEFPEDDGNKLEPAKAEPKQLEAPAKTESKAEPVQSKSKEAAKPKNDDDEFSDEQKDAMAELREIYKIKNNRQMLGLMQIWKKELKSLADVSPDMLDAFLKYYDDNEDEFEDYQPEEVA